jgi:hypothetical protein
MIRVLLSKFKKIYNYYTWILHPRILTFFTSGDFTERNLIIEFFKSLRPVSTEFHLSRVGGANDGGYLVPNDLDGLCGLISPGVGDSVTFDCEITSRTIPGVLIDASVPAPDLPSNLIFLSKYLGNCDDAHISINSVIHSYFSSCDDLFLSIDIEGDEWDVLKATSVEDLKKFRIITIELHYLNLILNKEKYSSVITPCISKLLDHFYVLHAHANNGGGYFYFQQFKFPRVLELTLIRKDRVKKLYGVKKLPHKLDSPNIGNKKELKLPKFMR